ncbi:MAG: ABC transporter permease subunit [Lachnospiraceae bacterium]|nr:ABC transporter permease subunit [Lachnospiraceae bacterium]
MKNRLTENKIVDRILKIALPLIFWIGLWEVLSLLVSDRLKLFLPGPFQVFAKWFTVGFTPTYLEMAGITLLRILVGFLLGILVGFLLGLLTHGLKIVDYIFAPAMKVIRAVPVVSFIIIAFLFVDVNNLPIVISFLMVVPLIWQSVHDSLANTSKELDAVSRLYNVGKMKTLVQVKLPQILPEFFSSCVSALGYAWKAGVAAEVLCTPAKSLGHIIYSAKAALNFDEVYAATLTVVLFSIIIEVLLKYICGRILKKAS